MLMLTGTFWDSTALWVPGSPLKFLLKLVSSPLYHSKSQLQCLESASSLCFVALKKKSFHFHWSSARAEGGTALSSPLGSQPSPRNPHPLPIFAGQLFTRSLAVLRIQKQEIMHQSWLRLKTYVQTLHHTDFFSSQKLGPWKIRSLAKIFGFA